jgi:hypothetical protein
LVDVRTTSAPLQGRKLESSQHDEATFRLNPPQCKGFRLIRAKIPRKISPSGRPGLLERRKSRNARRPGFKTRLPAALFSAQAKTEPARVKKRIRTKTWSPDPTF